MAEAKPGAPATRRIPLLPMAIMGTAAIFGALIAWAAFSGDAGQKPVVSAALPPPKLEQAASPDAPKSEPQHTDTPAAATPAVTEAAPTAEQPAAPAAESILPQPTETEAVAALPAPTEAIAAEPAPAAAVPDQASPPAHGEATPAHAQPVENGHGEPTPITPPPPVAPPETAAQAESAPVTAPPVAAPSVTAAPAPAATQGLPPAPDPRLVEAGRDGNLPVIGPDGRQPWRVYARPFRDITARPRIAIVIAGLGLRESTTVQAIEKLPPDITLAFTPLCPQSRPVVGARPGQRP